MRRKIAATRRKSLTAGRDQYLTSGRVRTGVDSPAFLSGNNGSWTNDDDRTRANRRNRRKQGAQKSAPTVSGNGAYKSGAAAKEVKQAIKSALIEVGRAGGGMLGTMTGIPALTGLGATLGGKLFEQGARIFGMGKYTTNYANNGPSIASNALIHSGNFNMAAKFAGDVSTMVVSGSEIFAKVYTSSVAGSTVALSYQLQPGSMGFCPELAGKVAGFSRYRPMGGIITFTPGLTDQTAIGNYAMKAVYNPAYPALTSFLDAANDTDSVLAQLAQPGACGLECDPRTLGQQWLMVRSGTLIDSNNVTVPLTETDHGTFYFVLEPGSSVGANTFVGYLTYKYMYLVTDPVKTNARFGMLRWSNTTYTNAAVLGANNTNATTRAIGNMVGTVVNTTSNVVSLTNANLNDYYRVTLVWYGSNAVFALPTVTYANCSSVNAWLAKTNSGVFCPVSGATTNIVTYNAVIQITSVEPNVPTITFGTGGTLPSSGTYVDLEIVSIGNGLPSTAI